MIFGQKILRSVRDSSPLSHSAARLLSVAAKENSSVEELVKVVECDAVLTANVLKAAVPAVSVRLAVEALGVGEVLRVALDACASALYQQPLEGYDSEKGALWRHSLKTALAARELAAFCRNGLDSGRAFTGGILHDIGKVIISAFLKDLSTSFGSEFLAHDNGSYLDVERRKLGTDHCEAGAALAEYWQLPGFYVDVARFHHHPGASRPEFVDLVYAIHLGDLLAMLSGAGTGVDNMKYQLDQGCSERFDLTFERLAQTLLKTELEFEKLSAGLTE